MVLSAEVLQKRSTWQSLIKQSFHKEETESEVYRYRCNDRWHGSTENVTWDLHYLIAQSWVSPPSNRPRNEKTRQARLTLARPLREKTRQISRLKKNNEWPKYFHIACEEPRLYFNITVVYFTSCHDIILVEEIVSLHGRLFWSKVAPTLVL